MHGNHDFRMRHDWSSEGVDWRDESMDEEMARDWLRGTHDPDSGDRDRVFSRVFELVESNLDPPRGWRLTKKLVELAHDDNELFEIGSRVLAMLVTWHEDLVGVELADLARSDPKYRQALNGQISQALRDFEAKHGLHQPG